MEISVIEAILRRIEATSVGVIGDFCLDAYWQLDPGPPELSIETRKPTLAVREQRYSLGGAGNVLSNVAALGAGKTFAFGIYTDDLFGRQMLLHLHDLGTDASGLILQSSGWQTPVYAKPYLGEEEQNRIDFGRFNVINPTSTRLLIDTVGSSLPKLDALIINQQLPHGIYHADLIAALNRFAHTFAGKTFVLDSRNRKIDFRSMIYKINASEAACIFGATARDNASVPADALRQYARSLYRRFEKPVFITRSQLGITAFDGVQFAEIPAAPVLGPVDPVGAGDTAVASIACSLAVGATLQQAAALANLASAVTVRKLRQTGTATPAEILELAARTGYLQSIPC